MTATSSLQSADPHEPKGRSSSQDSRTLPVGQVYNPINISKESRREGREAGTEHADRCIGNGSFYPNDIQEAKSLTLWGHGG